MNTKQGFTLIELMITVVIMITITTVLVFKQKSYASIQLLKNSIQNLALDLRQMQVYGISAKETSPGSQDFSRGYGFNLVTYNGPSAATYYNLFIDRAPQNGVMDDSCSGGASGAECQIKVTLPSGYSLSQICEVLLSGSNDCTMNEVNITFLRPDSGAHIILKKGSNVIDPSLYKGVVVKISNGGALTRSVVVYNNGQISVQ